MNIKPLVRKTLLYRVYRFFIHKMNVCVDKKRIYDKVKLYPKKNTVYLFGYPNHNNLGDNAQTYCTELWIQKNYPKMKIKEICTYDVAALDYYFIKLLSRRVDQSCIIILHSGYHTTDIYIYEELLNRAVVLNFKKHPILVMPQTVNFVDSREGDKSIKAYEKHKSILFLARDRQSYEKAKDMYLNARVELYPDIVTTLIGTYKSCYKREGILFCMRNDGEAFYSKDDIDKVRKRIGKQYKTDITDTSVSCSFKEIKDNRAKYIYDKIDEFSKYKMIITDRYHGTIFALIANTPVIVLNSTDHKLSSGVDWFKENEELKNRVFFCENIDNLYRYIDEIEENVYFDITKPYYEEKYYNNLKRIFESVK